MSRNKKILIGVGVVVLLAAVVAANFWFQQDSSPSRGIGNRADENSSNITFSSARRNGSRKTGRRSVVEKTMLKSARGIRNETSDSKIRRKYSKGNIGMVIRELSPSDTPSNRWRSEKL